MKTPYLWLGLGLIVLLTTQAGCSRPRTNERIVPIQARCDSLCKEAKRHRDQAQYAPALALADSALQDALTIQDTNRIVIAYNELGTICRRMGRLEPAIHFHYAAVCYAEPCSDTSFVARKNIVRSYNGLGNVYLSLGENTYAETYFRKALAGETALSSATGQAINYANIAALYSMRGELDSALIYDQTAMRINQEANNRLGIGLCHIYLGELHEKKHQDDQAIVEYQQAIECFKGIEDDWHTLIASEAIAALYLRQGELGKAYPLLQHIQQVSDDMESLNHQVTAHELWSSYYEQSHQPVLALKEFQTAIQFRDSLSDPKHDQQMRDIYIQYMRTRHEQQLAAEQRDKQQIKQLYTRVIALSWFILVLVIMIAGLLLHHHREQIRELIDRLQVSKHKDNVEINQENQAFLQLINTFLDVHMKESPSLIDLTLVTKLSNYDLDNRLRLLTNMTARQYVFNYKMQYAVHLLKDTKISIKEIAESCGFADRSYFARSVRKITGMSPRQYRDKSKQ